MPVKPANSLIHDCHVGAYRFADGTIVSIGPTGDGDQLRWRKWDGTTGAELRRFQLEGRQQVLSMSVSADGKRLLCCSYGFKDDSPQVFTVFDFATARPLTRWEEKDGLVASFDWPRFSPDGQTLVRRRDKGVMLVAVISTIVLVGGWVNTKWTALWTILQGS